MSLPLNKQLIKSFGPLYGIAFIFSLFINLLSLAVPLHMLLIFDRVFTGRSPATLIFVSGAALFALLIMGLLEGLRSRLLTRLSMRLDERLTGPVLLAMFRPPTAAEEQGRDSTPQFAPYTQGATDVNTVKSFLGGTGIFAFFDLPWLPIYLSISFMLHPVIGWVSLGGAVILLLLLVVNEAMTRRVSRDHLESGQDSAGLLATTQRNVHAVYSMGMLPAIVRRWHRLNADEVALETKVHQRTGTNTAMNRAVRTTLQAVILSVGAVLVIANELTTGAMIVGSIMMGKALQPLDIIMAGWKQFLQARIAASRLKKALEQSPALEISNSEEVGTGIVPVFEPQMNPRNVGGVLEMEREFSLPPKGSGLRVDKLRVVMGGTTILDGIDLKLLPGKAVWVIGESGSGKSSLAKAICGVYPVAGGRILLDDRDLPSRPDQERGPLLGYLPQDVELMPVTVGENIGRLDNNDSQAIIAAAKLAGAHDMILQLPHGYDTPVAPRAANLSAGQRQRIALARALYLNPRLLILDEPDANLDDEGRQALGLAINGVRDRGGLVMIISHRAWLQKLADEIFEMRDGNGLARPNIESKNTADNDETA